MNTKPPEKGIYDEPSHNKAETKGVKTLLGNPKKAIIKLAVAMIGQQSVECFQRSFHRFGFLPLFTIQNRSQPDGFRNQQRRISCPFE